MKKNLLTKRLLLTVAAAAVISINADAQFGNIINRAKQKVKDKIENKVENGISNAVDNATSGVKQNAKTKTITEANTSTVTKTTTSSQGSSKFVSAEKAEQAAISKFGSAPELHELMKLKPMYSTMDATDMTIKNFIWHLRTMSANDVKALAAKLTARAKWNREVLKAAQNNEIPRNVDFESKLSGQLANWECIYGNLIHVITLCNSNELKRNADGWYSENNSLMIAGSSQSGVDASRIGLENLKTRILFIRGKDNKGQFVDVNRQPRFLEPNELEVAKLDYNMVYNATLLLEGYPIQYNKESATQSMKDHFEKNYYRALEYSNLLNDAINGNSVSKLEFKPMPKAGSLNASLKAAALKIAKQQDSNTVNVVITRNAWDIKKNALGVPLYRVAYGYRIVQTKHGKRAVSCSWAQDHQGGGKYGSLRHFGVGLESFYVK